MSYRASSIGRWKASRSYSPAVRAWKSSTRVREECALRTRAYLDVRPVHVSGMVPAGRRVEITNVNLCCVQRTPWGKFSNYSGQEPDAQADAPNRTGHTEWSGLVFDIQIWIWIRPTTRVSEASDLPARTTCLTLAAIRPGK